MATKKLPFSAHIIYQSDVKYGDEEYGNPNDAFYSKHCLAEGDSWFSVGSIPISNLLYELRFRHSAQILSLAKPGDTIRRMSDISHNSDLYRFLAKNGFSYKFHIILLSGGGNDLIDNAKKLIKAKLPPGADANVPESYVDLLLLDSLLNEIADAYRRIAMLRDSEGSLSKNCPIVVHTYDYATPRNSPAKFMFVPIAGPWLYAAFEGAGIAVDMQIKVSDFLMAKLAESLLSLDCRVASGRVIPNFYVIDTRQCLNRANPGNRGISGDWQNEIHPNHDGYRKIADKLSAAIDSVISK